MNEAVSERDSLPKGWIKTTIDNVCLIILGRSPPSSTYNQDKVGLPFFQGKADFGTFHPTTRNWCTNPETFAEKNDILISVRAPVGPTNISLEKCCIGRGLAAVRSLDGVIFSYVFYHLRFLENYIATKGTGTTFKAIRGDQLRSITLSIPPLNEQKRIVSKIQSIFAQIDTKQQELEKLASQIRSVPDSFAELKGSILKKAFEGKLVPQDPDDEPVEAILKRIRRASEKELIFEKYDSPSGWIRVLLSDIAQINPPKPEKNSISDRLEVSFVPMRNVEALNGKIDLSETREYVKVRTGYTYFQNDDIIFAKITPCMENGKIAIVTGLKNGIGFGSTEFHVIRLKNEMLRKFYFLYFIQSDFRYSAQHKMKGTAGQLRVPSGYMKNILVPLPPLNEQKRIVAKIESIFAQIDTKQQELEKLASQIRSVPDSFAELKGSILKKAFRGRLVPQDPQDEPASGLLENIKQKSKDRRK